MDAVYRALDSRVAARLPFTPHIRGVYAYEDGALASFHRARQLGLRTLYELPIGYWKCYRELMEEEAIPPTGMGHDSAGKRATATRSSSARMKNLPWRPTLLSPASLSEALCGRLAPWKPGSPYCPTAHHLYEPTVRTEERSKRRQTEGSIRRWSEPAQGPELLAAGGQAARFED